MLLLAALLVVTPVLTIVASVAWGWRNGTLAESPQERMDWEFERIVRRI
jgi:hypothetical protein